MGSCSKFVLTTGQRLQAADPVAGDPGPEQHRLTNRRQLKLWNPLSGYCTPVLDTACEMVQVGPDTYILRPDVHGWACMYGAANYKQPGRDWDVKVANVLAWHTRIHGLRLPSRTVCYNVI